MSADPSDQQYGPTSGAISGWVGLAAAALLAVGLPLYEQDRATIRFAVGAALVGVLVWAFILRPRIILRTDGTVLLRNVFSTWTVPLAGVETVAVGAMTRIRLSTGATYDGLAVGRPVRSLGRERKEPSAADVVVERLTGQILAGAEQARATGKPVAPATRTWARPELAAIAVLVLALVLLSL